MLVVVYRITALRRELVTTHDDDCECRCYCVLSYLLLYFLCRRCSCQKAYYKKVEKMKVVENVKICKLGLVKFW